MDMLRAEDLWVEKIVADGPLPVLRGIDLEIPAGQVTVLLGESGAGKTLLARALSGLLPEGFRISRGRILLPRAADGYPRDHGTASAAGKYFTRRRTPRPASTPS